MKLHFEEIVELIHREMYVRHGVMLGSKAAAKAIMQAEEAAQGDVCPACLGGKIYSGYGIEKPCDVCHKYGK